MSTYVTISTLRAFPPNNLNRDESGKPKSAYFGGTKRQRFSSQCVKRIWRLHEEFRNTFEKDQLGTRSSELFTEVMNLLNNDTLNPEQIDVIKNIITTIGKKERSHKEDKTENEEKSVDESDDDTENTKAGRTSQLNFYTPEEVGLIADFFKQNINDLNFKTKKGKKGAKDTQVPTIEYKNLSKYLAENTKSNTVDCALFGRMSTGKELDNIDASIAVAHTIGIEPYKLVEDYFTAMDDLNTGTNATHIGYTSLCSSVMYGYANCFVEQLEDNLGKRTENGREATQNSKILARKTIINLLNTIAKATPTGKNNSTAPNTETSYLEVTIQNYQPLNGCNAFINTNEIEKSTNLIKAAIEKLTNHNTEVNKAYRQEKDIITKIIFCPIEEYRKCINNPDAIVVSTLTELLSKVCEILENQSK